MEKCMKGFCNAMGLLLLCGLTGCRGNVDKQDTVAPVKVKVLRVVSSEMAGTESFSGTVEEANGTALSFSVMGTLKTLHVGLGDRVAKGQLLATVDPTSMQSSYDAARVALEQAEDAHRRMKELYDKGSLPEMKWVEVQSKLQQAKSMETVARKHLDDCKLYAPFGGIVSEKSAEVGQNLMPGLPVVKLVTAHQLKVKIAVPETEIGTMRIGQRASITVSALNGRAFEGVVTEKGIVAHPLSRSYDVKIRVDDVDKELLPGMVVEVVLSGAGPGTCPVVPARIVQLDEQNRSFVWLNAGGKACKRIIRCGGFSGEGVIVLSGLKEGEEIIVEGQQKVCENTAIVL